MFRNKNRRSFMSHKTHKTRKQDRRKLFVESLEDRRMLATVAVFDNGAYVDTSGGTSSESDNIQASLASLGHTVSTFTSTTAAGITSAITGKDVLLIPELESGNLNGVLDAAARNVISNYVAAGSGLIVNGSNYSPSQSNVRDLLNGVFGLSLSVSGSLTGGSSSISAAASGTQFAGGPNPLAHQNGTGGLVTTSLPGGASSIYTSGSNTTVAILPSGSGNTVFLGFDWYNAAPNGTQDSGWLQVLDSAVKEVSNPSSPSTVVADANGPYVINEGQSLTLDASGSTASPSATYEWDVDGDGDYDENITGQLATVSWTQLDSLGLGDGPYTGNVSVRVTDSSSGGGGVTGVMTFDGSSGSPVSYSEAGMTVTTVHPSSSHHIHLDGTRLFNHGNCCSTPYEFTTGGTFTLDSLDVSRFTLNSNATFVASPGGASITVTGNGTITFPSVGWSNITSFRWDQSIGTTYIDNVVFSSGAGTGGGVDTDTTTLTINNLPPVANAGADQTVDEGDLVTLNGSFTDPGTNDGHKQEWSVVASNGESIAPQTIDNLSGDSNGSGGSSYSFTPGDNGTYTVTYKVTDDDGGVHSDVAVITVNNVAPTLSNVAITSPIDENDSATLSGNIGDVGALDSFTLDVVWGDGNVQSFSYPAGTTSFSETHQYLDDDPTATAQDTYEVNVTLNDDDGGTGVLAGGGGPTTILSAVNRGWWNQVGSHSSSNNNTFTGFSSQYDYNSYFTFDISSVAPATDLVLRLEVERWYSPDSSETVRVSDVSTPAATLEASGQNVGIYTDLETGNSYASVVIQQTDVGTVVDMPLTLQAVADFNSVSDFFSVGLSVDSLTRFTGNEGVRFSGSSEPRIHLLAVDHDAGGGLTVTVNNVDPVANADADQTVDEGDLVTLNGSFTDQGTDDGHKEEWTVVASNGESIAPLTINNLTGDSNGSGGSSFSFTPGDNGTYTVTYTVTDDDGGVHSDISVISVNNVDPEILSLSATSVNEDGTVTLTGTYDDAGSLDTHTIDIDWGLGETASLGVVVSGGGFSVTHQYLDDNPTITPSDVYAIGVTLDDDDGGSDSDSTTTTITNVDPVIDSFTVDSAVINEDGSVTVSGSISDVGTQDTHTVEIDWGGSEGTSAATVIQGAGSATFTATHQYLDDDPSISSSDTYTITATVTDDDSGQDTDALDITVNNVAPAITDITSGAEKCGTAHEDDPITLDLSFDDIGSLDVHTVEIDWGDNETDTIVLTAGDRTLSVDHDYDTGGIYTIIVTVTDDDSGLDQTSLLAVVSGVGLNGGVLQIIGTAGDDHVTLNQTGNGLLKVHADFIPEDALGETRDFPLADVNRIFMLLCDGNDHATISGRITLDAIIDGGAGDDHLNGGDGSNVILGREGNDHINGGSGRDILIGGLGEDRIVGNPESDLISGGVLQNSSTTATDSIGDEDNLLTMQARLQDATDTEIDDWVAGTDDFFAGLELELVDDGGVADQLTGSSADDLFFAFANDDVTDASSNGNGNGGTNKGKGKK